MERKTLIPELGYGMMDLLMVLQIGILEIQIVIMILNLRNVSVTGKVVIYGMTALVDKGTPMCVRNNVRFISIIHFKFYFWR